MCEPLVIGASIASMVVGGYSAYQSTKADKQQADYQTSVSAVNAQLSEQQAKDVEKRSVADIIARQRETARMCGEQINILAANGLDISTGSAASILEDTLMFGREDVNTIAENARREAYGYRTQAKNYASDAQAKSQYADSLNPNTSAGLTLLTGAPSIANTWLKYNPPMVKAKG